MPRLTMRYAGVLGLIGLMSPVQAETRLSLGVGAAPDYIGSDDIRAIPMPGFAFDLGGLGIKSNGLGIEANMATVVGAPRGLQFGPILRYDLGRNDGSKVNDAVVAQTAPIKAAPEIGGFIAMGMPLNGDGNVLGTARLSVVQGLGDGPQGLLTEASLGVMRMSGAWRFGGQVTLAAGSDDYQDARFGVSAADAAATGSSSYTAKGGLRDVGLGGFASYAVNDRLAVNLTVGVSRLSDNAADSPLVAERGGRTQSFVGLGLTYSFR